MFDATKLLGSFLQNRQPGTLGTEPSSPGGSSGKLGGMVQQALSQFAGGRSTGGLGGLLSQFTGSSQQDGGGQSGGPGMIDQVGDMARRTANDPVGELRGNNPAAVGGVGALAGALMGGGRGAMGGGLLAVLGSLAYAAYQKQGAAASALPGTVPGGSGTPLQAYADPAEVQRKASLVLSAMIQATKADGQLDDAERRHLAQHMAGSGDDLEAQAFLRDQMAAPVDIAGLVAQVRSPQEGAEIYAASVVAINLDTQAERDYLAQLATALRLSETVVSHVHASLNPER